MDERLRVGLQEHALHEDGPELLGRGVPLGQRVQAVENRPVQLLLAGADVGHIGQRVGSLQHRFVHRALSLLGIRKVTNERNKQNPVKREKTVPSHTRRLLHFGFV
uniref:(northern house mosquito) hypothetical protein n=1 Tax=Culex pipiens TaxID=7175 RepID=A0A8D8FJJ4_CULPI